MRPIPTAFPALLLMASASLAAQTDPIPPPPAPPVVPATAGPDLFDPATHCRQMGSLKGSSRVNLTETTPVMKTPEHLRAPAFCLKIPPGAKSLLLRNYATGGLTYRSQTIVPPSARFLDEHFALVRDYPDPKAQVREYMMKGIGLSAEFRLDQALAPARYVVFYGNPALLGPGVEVFTGMEVITIPYAVYGEINITFSRSR
jgi:hypothetical protein